jgi:putative addiction module CopG family antidote
MEIRPTPDQETFIREAVASGRFDNAEAAVKDALALWEERERRRAEILAAIDEAESAIGRGEGIAINSESMRELAEDVKSRGRARLAGERQALR